MVVSCGTETGDGSKGSGALYVSGFDGSFPYILAGEFVCRGSKSLSIKNSLFFCCCESVVSDVSRESILCDFRVRQSPYIKEFSVCICQLVVSSRLGSSCVF